MIHQERVFLFATDMGNSANAVFYYDDGEEDGIPLVQAKISNGYNQHVVLEFSDFEEVQSYEEVMKNFFESAKTALESTRE